MFELSIAFAALIAVLTLSWFKGRIRKQDAMSRIEAAPQDVERLYLRHAPDVDAYWLHVRFNDGKKRVLAAPWEIAAVLARLEPLGLRLCAEDEALLAQRAASGAEAPAPARIVQGSRKSEGKFGLSARVA